MAKKLQYFQLNGLAESIRYMLHYGGQKFEDIRHNLADWPIKSVKDSLPYGQLPLYEEGDKSLNQSFAIARYVASQYGLLPSSPWEQAVLDAMVLSMYDFWSKNKISDYLYEKDPVKKAALKKYVAEENVPYYFARFERDLKKNNGYVNGKLSWADFVLVSIVEAANLFFDDVFEKDYPTITNLMKTIHNLPKVKEYIATREPYSL